jgi:hypothetical protein
MPKNSKGGKHKHMKKNVDNSHRTDINKMPTPEDYSPDDPVYIGFVTTILGNCRFKVKQLSTEGLSDIEIMCHLRESKKRLGRIGVGTLVMYAIRDYETGKDNENDKKGDIEYTYSKDQIPFLKQLKLIHPNYEIFLSNNSQNTDVNEDNGFVISNQPIDVDRL